MLIVLMLLLVPAVALGLVLGMDRVEDNLLREPSTRETTPAPTAAVLP